MFSRIAFRRPSVVLVLGLLLSQGCGEIASPISSSPVATVTQVETLTATDTPEPTKIPTATSVPTITLTPVPTGVFVLFFYEPLVMEYDPSVWDDRSNYRDWGMNRNPATGTIIENYLQARNMTSCAIGVQGPTGFQQVTPEKVQLSDVDYRVITFTDNKSVSAYYIEDHSLSGYDYEPGLPIPVIQASSSEWEECKTLAEEVLATLHVP